MSIPTITPNMRMVDLVTSDPRVLDLLPRFGIEFGFGDITLAKLCKEKGIDTAFFLLMINTFLNPNYLPKQTDSIDPKLLLLYLKNSHSYYLNEKVPRIIDLINQFIKNSNHPVLGQLQKFLDEYVAEVKDHIDYEERTAFPYIQLMLGEQVQGETEDLGHNYSIGEFQEHHSDIEEKLSDLKNLLIMYIPSSNNPYLRIQILKELIGLEEDLVNHARIEEKILVPIVERMEREKE